MRNNTRHRHVGVSVESTFSLLKLAEGADVLHQIGDLVTISKNKAAPPGVLWALVRLYGRSSLPHGIEFSVGMQKFFVMVTDERVKDPSFFSLSGALSHSRQSSGSKLP